MSNQTTIKNYINGELVAPQSGRYIANIEPATGRAYSYVPDSDEQDVQRAVEAASIAFTTWQNTPVDERSRYLVAIANRIEDKLQELAAAESRDNGKPVKLATQVDIPRAASNFRFFGTAAPHFASESHQMEDQAINYTLRQPLGVCGCISPWNLPLYLFTWKIAPALAAGNCVVAKPSELTPMTSYLLGEICQEVELPAGVLNILHGYGHKAGQAIVENDTIKALSFTGGTQTGKQIATTVAPSFKKLSLEMGGKNPNIIFADCDFEQALKTSVKSSFANQGEICLCGSRIFIERSIYTQFRDALLEKVKELTVGDPQDPDTNLGAVISAEHQQKILSYIQLAKEEGGTILAGGEAVDVGGRCANGSFVKPTVIEGLDEYCRVNQEEIFGPVVTLIPFDEEKEAIRMANATEYGLAATIWTQDVSRAHRVAQQVQSGIIWINCWLLRDLRTPFGGMKHSGQGREGGWEAFRFFTEAKNVCVKI